MRLLHTSDWPLGRAFHLEDLLAAQARFVDFLVDTVRSEGVYAVLVSGDVYDRALPPVDAVALCDDALRRLAGTGARVVLISGNHDSLYAVPAALATFAWLACRTVGGVEFIFGGVGKRAFLLWESYLLVGLFAGFGTLSLRIALNPKDRLVHRAPRTPVA